MARRRSRPSARRDVNRLSLSNDAAEQGGSGGRSSWETEGTATRQRFETIHQTDRRGGGRRGTEKAEKEQTQSPPFSRETSELAAIRGPGRCIGEAKGEGFGAQKRGNVTNSSKDVPGCLVINIGKAIVLKRGHREPRLLS